MSRIYKVTHAQNDTLVRFVRALSKNAAVRAVAAERFAVSAASAEDIVFACESGAVSVLDALGVEADDSDPGPVPPSEGIKDALWRDAREPGKIADLSPQLARRGSA